MKDPFKCYATSTDDEWISWDELESKITKKEKKMSNWLTPVAKKVVKVLRSGTRAGKVDRLEDLSKSLTQNTALVAEKYDELEKIEEEVKEELETAKKTTYKKELETIQKMDLLPEKDKNAFSNALTVIKAKAVTDLEPIGETAQRIKAHMLVTMHKALQQKAVLVAKTKLARNATLQLATLKIISQETKDINVELKQLLKELDELNMDALNKHSAFRKDVEDTLNGENTEGNVVDSILTRMEKMNATENSTKSKETAKQ